MPKSFHIHNYPFDKQLEFTLLTDQAEALSWPIVYLLNNKKLNEAYVGETTDMISRFKIHLKHQQKSRLSSALVIRSDLFNKSAALDIESNLIRYLSADGQFHLLNGNLGISNHTYYQKREVYWKLFQDIWDELRALGISRHSLDYIDNSDLFKYSPYKSLSREQIQGLKTILHCLLDDKAKTTLIHGGAGTGKSILAIFLFKLLLTDLSDFNLSDFDEEDAELFHLIEQVKCKYQKLEMALVIPMASFRKTIANVFKNIKGLSQKMVIGPSEVGQKAYDLLIVDEGHRLRQRKNLASYFATFDKVSNVLGLNPYTASELDWILLKAKKSVIFYDEFQSIKPSDTSKLKFQELIATPTTRVEYLKSQFRVRGGTSYTAFIHSVFADRNTRKPDIFRHVDYEIKLYESVTDLVKDIKAANLKHGLCRLVAGYAWEWISKHNSALYDIQIDDVQLRWNTTAIDWVNSPTAIHEVGCIHTTQGYDLNYTGVIIGPELDFDFETRTFVVYKDRYKDKNGKNSILDLEILKNYVLNIYRTILFRGIKGTFIYACNENLRQYLAQYISLANENVFISNKTMFSILSEPSGYAIPYYDLKVAAGSFSELQQVDDSKWLNLDEDLCQDLPSLHENYFACKVVGDSMNKVIPNGAICLFKKYQGGSRNGLICLVESMNIHDPELGGHYTIKEYSSKKTVSEEGWQHQEIVLNPLSLNTSYKPIRLREEEIGDLKVVGVFVKVIGG